MGTLSKIGHQKKSILEDLNRKAVTDILSREKKNGSMTLVNKTLTVYRTVFSVIQCLVVLHLEQMVMSKCLANIQGAQVKNQGYDLEQ